MSQKISIPQQAVIVTLIAAILFLVAGPALVKAADKQKNQYDFDVEQLKTKDCAQCHFSHYTRLKDEGAKHQGVVCTECHATFHAYNPRKNNFDAIMPQCSTCHNLPHGDLASLPPCLSCHTDPHRPLLSLPTPAVLEPQCRSCHAAIDKTLTDFPSMHTQQECSACHSEKHGRKPVCTECHESHSPKVTMEIKDCLACHPVHSPLQISYPETQSKELCAGCHEQPFNELAANPFKHATLTCAKCHPSHGFLPRCQSCHGEAPHNKTIHEKYINCSDCHNTAHDLQK